MFQTFLWLVVMGFSWLGAFKAMELMGFRWIVAEKPAHRWRRLLGNFLFVLCCLLAAYSALMLFPAIQKPIISGVEIGSLAP